MHRDVRRTGIKNGFGAAICTGLLLSCLGAGSVLAERPLLVTVDDLPIAVGSLHAEPAERARITREMLDALDRHDIRAVGLVTWRNVRGPEDLKLLEMWLDAGHELGNHSYSHLDLTTTDAETWIADVERGRAKLAAFLEPRGETVRFFRFPLLHEGDTPQKLTAVREYLERSGQRNLPVTIDNQDYGYERPWVAARQAGDEEAMAAIGEDYLAALRIFVRHHERTGDNLFQRELPQVLLLHANEVGAGHGDRLFTWLRSSGHRFADADEVLADPVFDEPVEFVGPKGYGLWDRMSTDRSVAQARREVEEHLAAQIVAWNSGDLESFCSGYDEDALFLTPKGVTRGRDEILARYRESYADRAAMGTLSFELIEIRPAHGVEVSLLGDSQPGGVHAVGVAARWILSYPDREDASGLTMLYLRRRGDGWSIAQDSSM
jgi:peptidoglycan/xylan/chitin deacetylase (PgdA/CDA1 family)